MMNWRINRPDGPDYWKLASCAEVNCRNYASGWQTIIPLNDFANIDWIKQSGMEVVESREGGLITFYFAPGQECFDSKLGRHRIALDRDPVMSVNKVIVEPLEYMDIWNDYHYRRGVNG
jgi:lipoate-protein ligase B